MEDNSYVYDYEIATGATPKELVVSVRKLLEKEYEPEGAAFFAAGLFCQTMILWDEEKEEVKK